VVLETPKGSRNKYKYDPKCAAIRLGATLAAGLEFPFDFGFFPSTLAQPSQLGERNADFEACVGKKS
jgi:inorganic pyrophosphatase